MATVDGRAQGVAEVRTSHARSGMVVPRVFSTEGVSPFDQVEWDLRTAAIKDEKGRVHLPADRLRGPQGLEPARHQRRGQQVLLRRDQHSRARDQRPAPGRPGHPDDRRLGPAKTATSPPPRTPSRFYDELTSLCLNQYGSFNSPVWFNVGLYPSLRDRRPGQQLAVGRGDPRRRQGHERLPVPASLGLLHPERRRRHAGHHAAGDLRGDALQVRLGDRHRPLDPPLEPGEARRRRQALRPGQLHAGLRRDRQRHQVGRQDPPRRQDADAQDLAPRHPRIHRVQDQGREEGPDPDRRRATRPTSTARPTARSCSRTPTSRSACTDALPPRRRGRRRMDHPRRHHRPADGDVPRPQADGRRSPRGPGSAATPACSTRTPSSAGTPAPTPRRSTAVNPCSEYMFIDDSCVQPRVDQPDEVPPRGRHLRRQGVPGGLPDLHHGAGDPGRPRELPDRSDRARTATSSARWGWATPTSAA